MRGIGLFSRGFIGETDGGVTEAPGGGTAAADGDSELLLLTKVLRCEVADIYPERSEAGLIRLLTNARGSIRE